MATVRKYVATIANGESQSNSMGVGEMSLLAIVMPASWTAANLTFLGSYDNGTTFQPLHEMDGDEITVVTAASRTCILDPAVFTGLDYVKIRSCTTGGPVNQGAARTLTVAYRSFA
jgi:hypothetical protein